MIKYDCYQWPPQKEARIGQFGTYDSYSAMLDDEARLATLRAKGDALSPEEVAEKVALFRTLSTTGRRYTDVHIVNTVLPLEPPEQQEGSTDATAEQRQAEARFGELRGRPYDLTPPEQTELHRLYLRFGTQPARYTRSGVTLHIGR